MGQFADASRCGFIFKQVWIDLLTRLWMSSCTTAATSFSVCTYWSAVAPHRLSMARMGRLVKG